GRGQRRGGRPRGARAPSRPGDGARRRREEQPGQACARGRPDRCRRANPPRVKPDNSDNFLSPVCWADDRLMLVDQRLLPADELGTLVVRGAPVIGVGAAFGVALVARQSRATTFDALLGDLEAAIKGLAATRPTAVNLFWALERMRRVALVSVGVPLDRVKARLLTEAQAIRDEDIAANRALGTHGAALVPADARIRTHSNAGALATAGFGTALGVIRAAHAQGRVDRVWVDETRPVMQGSRLTAWECAREGIPHTLIVDVVAAARMARGQVALIVTRADRIATNGDT